MLKVEAKAMGFTTYKGGHYEQNTKDRNGCPQHKLIIVNGKYQVLSENATIAITMPVIRAIPIHQYAT